MHRFNYCLHVLAHHRTPTPHMAMCFQRRPPSGVLLRHLAAVSRQVPLREERLGQHPHPAARHTGNKSIHFIQRHGVMQQVRHGLASTGRYNRSLSKKTKALPYNSVIIILEELRSVTRRTVQTLFQHGPHLRVDVSCFVSAGISWTIFYVISRSLDVGASSSIRGVNE